MKSHEVLKLALDEVGVKAVAAELKLSPALIYKWCQESGDGSADSSGARNPLDRLADIVRVTDSQLVVNWLCQEAGGFFVSNPTVPTAAISYELLDETQKLVKDFGQLLLTVTKSVEDDGHISGHEADQIRHSWETLKATAESFTVCCELGRYAEKSKDEEAE